MECPRCKNDKFSPEGICLACNYQAERTETPPEREFNDDEKVNASQSSEADTPADTASLPPKDEIPNWQKELSQRLAEIKLKKEAEKNFSQAQGENLPPKIPPARPRIHAIPSPSPKEQSETVPARSQTQEAPVSPGIGAAATPRQRTIASLGPEVYTADKADQNSSERNVKDLIDNTISRRSIQPAKESPIFIIGSPPPDENKLILLSRTLAGLIDLIIVVLCTVVFIISADYFSGIVILDILSLVEYAGLFLIVFLLYSIFFLATSGQTVGMMITDLRVTGIQENRPSVAQLFLRCFGFLLSVIALGTGLLWSLVDRDSMCFHDRFSNTSVKRL